MSDTFQPTYRLRHRARKLRFERSQLLNRQLTIRDVANVIGVDESRLSRFEAQTGRTLDVDLLNRLITYYNLSDPRQLFEFIPTDGTA